jgi:hypothetical protein
MKVKNERTVKKKKSTKSESIPFSCERVPFQDASTPHCRRAIWSKEKTTTKCHLRGWRQTKQRHSLTPIFFLSESAVSKKKTQELSQQFRKRNTGKTKKKKTQEKTNTVVTCILPVQLRE